MLADNASDVVVATYAHAQRRFLITHDRGCANRARRIGVPHIYLRTPETQDRDRLIDVLPQIEMRLGSDSLRVVVTRFTLTFTAV